MIRSVVKILLAATGILVVLMVLFAFAAAVLLSVMDWPMNALPRMTAPKELATQDYALLPDLAGNDDFLVAELTDYGVYSRGYYLPDEQVVYLALYKGDESRGVFIDRHGDIIDSIVPAQETYRFDNFFVELDGYYEAGADYLTELMPYEVIDEDVSRDILKTYYRESTFFHQFNRWTNSPDGAEARSGTQTHVMLHHGVWKKLTTDFEYFLDTKPEPLESLNPLSPELLDQASAYSKGQSRVESIGIYSLHLDWFDRRGFSSARGPQPGSTTGGTQAETWYGIGYYSLRAGDAQFRFSVDKDAYQPKWNASPNLVIRGREELDFVLLQVPPYFDFSKLFIVKLKGSPQVK